MSKFFRGISAMAVLAVGAFASNANAAGLGLIAGGPTDVAAQGGSFSYTAPSGGLPGVFIATGQTDMLNLSNVGFTKGTFSLTVYFDANNVIDASKLSANQDVLTVTGGTAMGTSLYSSTLFQKFAFSGTPANGLFEFVFGPGSGTFGSLGTIGVKIQSQVTSSYNCTTNVGFVSSGIVGAQEDTFVVPLPSSALMGLSTMALLPLFLMRRKA